VSRSGRRGGGGFLSGAVPLNSYTRQHLHRKS